MATNSGVTLAKVRAGTATFVQDSSTYSAEVTAIQKALKLLGFWGSSAAPDGYFGAYTTAGVKGYQFEKMNQTSPTGEVDQATLSSIETSFLTLYAGHSTSPNSMAILNGFDYVNNGCTGTGVTSVQIMLNNNGYNVTESGSFDDTTEAAVRQFQTNNNLTVDGSVGQQTFCALNNGSATWYTSSRITLTHGVLARCGFSGFMLRQVNVDKLNDALNTYNINTKEKVKHFLAQCRAETANGTQVVEYGYQAGTTGSASYAPYYGAGYLHLTHDYNYTAFYDYMVSQGVSDSKIKTPNIYATQHVAFNYPAQSAGWFWDVYAKLNSSSVVDWSGTASTICTTLTKKIYGSSSDATKRLGFYNEISEVLK